MTWRNTAQGGAPSPAAARGRAASSSAQHAGDRQDHIGQQDVDHRQVHRERGVQQPQRGVDQVQGAQGLVDQPVALQQDHPGVGAYQDAGPERQQDDDQGQLRGCGTHAGQGERHRIAQQQRPQRDDEGGAEGVGEHAQERLVAREPDVVAEREARFGDAARQHGEHRQGVEHQHEEHERQDKQESAGVAAYGCEAGHSPSPCGLGPQSGPRMGGGVGPRGRAGPNPSPHPWSALRPKPTRGGGVSGSCFCFWVGPMFHLHRFPRLRLPHTTTVSSTGQAISAVSPAARRRVAAPDGCFSTSTVPSAPQSK